jgi:archaemetzincin
MLSKIVNHELCHTFAMKHCIYFSCLMNGSKGYHEASTKEAHLCPICLRKLQSELKFDIVERYEALGDDKSIDLASKIKKSLGLSK